MGRKKRPESAERNKAYRAWWLAQRRLNNAIERGAPHATIERIEATVTKRLQIYRDEIVKVDLARE